MSNKVLAIFIAVLALSGCKDPITPESPKAVVVSGPTTGLTGVTYTFKTALNFTPDNKLWYKWVFDDTTLVVFDSLLKRSFGKAGIHPFTVHVLVNGTQNELCSTRDTITIWLTPYLTISPDSAYAKVATPTTFKITLQGATMPSKYSVTWQMDTAHVTVANKDTLSYTFWTIGTHTITAYLLDSLGHGLALGRTVQFDTVHTYGPSDTTSHNFVWREYSGVNGENNMTGCWVFGPNDIWTVNGDLHHFNGTSWTTVVVHDDKGHSGQGTLSGCSIFGFSDNDLWLTNAGVSLHYVGNNTVIKYTTYDIALAWTHNCWGTSSNDLYVVGDSGAIFHFDGTNWTKMSTPTKKNLYSISGTSSTDIWAAGYNVSTGESELLHYDGSTWSQDQLSVSGQATQYGLGDVFACDSAGHRFVAVAGDVVFRQTDGAAWRLDTSVPNGDHIGFGIRGNSPNDLMVAGGWGLAAHWSGKTWHRYDQFFAPGALGYGASGASFKDNTICIVGTKNGTSWVLIGQRQ